MQRKLSFEALEDRRLLATWKGASTTSLFIAAFTLLSAAILSTVAAGEYTAATKDVPNEARIGELISQLGSEDFAARESATQSLLEAGPAAFQAVESAQTDKDPEIRNRAKLIRQGIVEMAVVHLEERGVSLSGKRSSPTMLSARNCRISDDDLVYVGCLRSLTLVALDRSPITDKGMKHVRHLRRLEDVSLLACNNITHNGVEHLKGMPHLRELGTIGCKNSDATLAIVSTLPQLERLNISGAISDEGLSHLTALKNLNWILFKDCKISGVGLAKLRPLAGHLQSLRFYNVPLTDADLQVLAQFPELQFVDINDAPITDAGVDHLTRLPKLNTLALQGTKITDKCIIHLREMRGLRYLRLSDTSVTANALAQLRELPALHRLIVPSALTDAQLRQLEHRLRLREDRPRVDVTRN